MEEADLMPNLELQGAINRLRLALAHVEHKKHMIAVSVDIPDLKMVLDTARYDTGKPGSSPFIPGEPTFIIRGTDARAITVLAQLDAWRFYGNLSDVLSKFREWQADHTMLVHEPD